jgi:hypothetical protein
VGLIDTVGAETVVAHGYTAVSLGDTDAVVIVVHPSAGTPLSRSTLHLLGQANAAVAVDRAFLSQRPADVRRLVDAGVVLVNAGSGPPYQTGLLRGRSVISRNARATEELTGVAPRFYLSGPEIDLLDVRTVRRAGEVFVQPTLRVARPWAVPTLTGGKIVLIECAGAVDCQLGATLRGLLAQPMVFAGLRTLDR